MSLEAAGWEGQTLDELKRRWARPHIHLYTRIDSTNSRAKELACAGAPAGTIVLADEQSGGRGVAERRWHSPKGSGLYISFVFRPPSMPNPLLVPVLAGLGVARAVERTVDGVAVGVKWPNDLIVADRKAGGVLSETSWTTQGMPGHLVVGIGVNVHQAASDFPPQLRDVAISLDMASGRTVSRLELADFVIAEVEARCAAPPESLDSRFLRQFERHDWLRDRRCAVTKPGAAPVQGTAVGIAPDGALLFRPDGGAQVCLTTARVTVNQLPTPEY